MIIETRKGWELEQGFKEIQDWDVSLRCAKMYVLTLEVKM